MKRLFFGLLFLPSVCWGLTPTATPNKYMVENTSGTASSNGAFCYDFQTKPTCAARITNLIATISTSSIPSGATSYIQNTLTPTTTTQVFTVSSGTAVNLSATGFTALTSTSTNFNATTIIVSTLIPSNITGTTTNNNAGPGNVGFFISSATNNPHLATTTGQYGDVVSIPLAAGDWLVSASAIGDTNVASFIGAMFVGVSTTAANSTAGLIDGYSVVYASAGILNTNNAFSVPFSVSDVRFSLSSAETVYLKYRADYQNSNPRISGSIKVRKPR